MRKRNYEEICLINFREEKRFNLIKPKNYNKFRKKGKKLLKEMSHAFSYCKKDKINNNSFIKRIENNPICKYIYYDKSLIDGYKNFGCMLFGQGKKEGILKLIPTKSKEVFKLIIYTNFLKEEEIKDLKKLLLQFLNNNKWLYYRIEGVENVQ